MKSFVVPKKRLGSVKAVAARLDVTERWIWKALSNAKFGPVPIRLGRSVKFDLDELEHWIDAGCPAREQWQVLRKTETGKST